MILAAPTDGTNTTLTEAPNFIGRVGLNIRGRLHQLSQKAIPSGDLGRE